MGSDHEVSTVRIGGIPIAELTYEGALAYLLDAPSTGRRLAVHFCTAHTLVEATDDATLRAALLDGNLDVADGVPLVWVARARGRRMERICGLDVLPDLADRGRGRGARHYFYGGGEGVAQQLASRLAARYPGLTVAGCETPPYRSLSPEERTAMVSRLNAARPDYVWVGLGTPKQDLWLAEYRDQLEAPALLAVGAAFDIIGGFRPRAPYAMQRAGLEWLFRLVQEPRRLAVRYTIVNARFLVIVLADLSRRRPRGRLRRPRPPVRP
jgi:N-acetylglucosaminyldiphosphoundecaprenol N-acetyl-beta-D-mannosaminyltransferase